MMNNAWYSTFGDIPIVERNRQDEARDQSEFVNSFFFNERISDAQTLNNWKSLEQIKSLAATSVDPGVGGQLIAYRANMIGVVPQLKACGQFQDLGGQVFDIKDFLENTIYNISRVRKSIGRPYHEIDVYTDSTTADQFFMGFVQYSKWKVGDLVQINVPAGEAAIGFPYRKFKLYKPNGIMLNVLTDPFFDDLVSAEPTGSDVGHFLMVLDLGQGGTSYPGLIASHRKRYKVGDIDELAKVVATFSCVMEYPTRERVLTSETTTAVVECPRASYIVANFSAVSFTIPTLLLAGTTPSGTGLALQSI
jgi:hypothetical protein